MTVSNIEKYRSEIKDLIFRGQMLVNGIINQSNPQEFRKQVFEQSKSKQEAEKFIKDTPNFQSEYQGWYSEAISLIKQILPERLEDFRSHYDVPKNRKILSAASYVIADALQGLHRKEYDGTIICDASHAIPHMQQQIAIVRAIERRFESSLFDIRQIVQADLFDDELSAARELLKRGFVRAAGAVAGVVLEHHLSQVCENHKITISKKNPTISDFNDNLKSNDVIDTPRWRSIQLLGDLRNLCDHNKEREPSKQEGEDLILGVERLIKSLF